MKQQFLFLLAIVFTLSANSQIFKKDDIVEVDPLLSDTAEGAWKRATVLDFDSAASKYTVIVADGNQLSIPSKGQVQSKYYEKWIRPVLSNKQDLSKYGTGYRNAFEKRINAVRPIRCNGSEVSVKRNIKSLIAAQYEDYPYIFVDYTSFKGQNGYERHKNGGQQVYPYKIEMLVHLKLVAICAGREYIHYQTWEYDREYEYVTGPGKNCEVNAAQTAAPKLVSNGWY